jgi:hypothetical protein
MVLSCCPAGAEEWSTRAEVGVRHDTNINNSPFASDILRDRATSATVSTGTSFPLGVGEDLALRGEFQSEVFDRYKGVSNRSLGAQLTWWKKWGLGAYAPWTGVELSSTRLNFNSSIRNSWRHQLTPGIGQRLSEQWNLRGDYQLEWRTAKSLEPDQPGLSGDVFSQTSQNLILNAEYTWNDKLQLAFGYLIRRGDVVATVQEHPGTNIVESSKAIALDPVFGDEFYTYRLTGTTQGPSLIASIMLSPKWLMKLSMQNLVTHAAGGNAYRKSTTAVSWRYDF